MQRKLRIKGVTIKFNSQKISHWAVALIGLFNTVIAASLKRFNLLGSSNNVLFYGHVLNGNLKQFYDYLEDDVKFKSVFVTMFPSHKKSLSKQGVRVFCTASLIDSLKIARSKIIITDHGAHFLFPVYKHTTMKFVDVWHGVPYKGWDEESFSEQKYYDELWLSSEYFIDIYKKQYGFSNKLVATGYARTDPLYNGLYTKKKLTDKYSLPSNNKHLILIAPTWKQDSSNRSIIPFNETMDTFFKKLNQLAKQTDSLIIFRAHLNSGDDIDLARYKNVCVMPYAQYPIAEEFLGAADLLVTDWSSIAFDFLVTKRPVIYLDVDPPFEKGFTLDASYRFGPVVGDMQQLGTEVAKYVNNNVKYQSDFKYLLTKSNLVAYGKLADGKVSDRYYKRLKALMKNA